MGTDSPIAALSDKPRLLFDYFTQLFAQVTNPPLDTIREELVTSLSSSLGPVDNLLHAEAASCRPSRASVVPVYGREDVWSIALLPQVVGFSRVQQVRRAAGELFAGCGGFWPGGQKGRLTRHQSSGGAPCTTARSAYGKRFRSVPKFSVPGSPPLAEGPSAG
jgi:hypothetical protein